VQKRKPSQNSRFIRYASYR